MAMKNNYSGSQNQKNLHLDNLHSPKIARAVSLGLKLLSAYVAVQGTEKQDR